MFNKKIKRTLCALVVSLCLAGSTVPALAETVGFDITVPGDIVSKKAEKADNEQKFYVTGTYFSNRGTLMCTSIRYNKPEVKSYVASIAQSVPRHNARYISYAESGVYYYMQAKASVPNLHVVGRYTP